MDGQAKHRTDGRRRAAWRLSLAATLLLIVLGTGGVAISSGGTNILLAGYGIGPSISSLSPNVGPTVGGTTVTITGTEFTAASAVDFGATSATSFTVDSATSITAIAPAGAGVADVTVTTPNGTSPTSPSDQFTYVPLPTVTGVSPNSGPRRGGTAVTITGTNFTNVVVVSFGSTSATSFTINSASSITAVAPAGAGTVDVTVTTADATSATSPIDHFSYPIPSAPAGVATTAHNGSVTISWHPSASQGTAPITSYVVAVKPCCNNRLPAPKAASDSKTVSATALSLSLSVSGLVEDCHQRYEVSVAAKNANGVGPAVKSPSFRPSGIVVPGAEPPYVVILLDGINESQPTFTMDPYYPTLDQTEPQGYCPESWNASKQQYNEADFRGAAAGPWSFFHKWNFGEVDSNGNQTGNYESKPRALEGNQNGIAVGTETHSFMLDAIAGRGAVILPYSYLAASLIPATNADPEFSFTGYEDADSTPGRNNSTVTSDASVLATEVQSIENTWPSSKIVVLGHSQGGLIAWSWYQAFRPIPKLVNALSLDSPINGVCVTLACLGPPTYPEWNKRETEDPGMLRADKKGWPFRFIGTYGDPVEFGGFYFYGEGAETLEHQLLFPYSSSVTSGTITNSCSHPADERGCPAPSPPDHISECPLVESEVPEWEWREGHYVVKYCPGDVAYFNSTLKVKY